jgi:predicted RNase H-like nuclease (RuvC/YqgF family)
VRSSIKQFHRTLKHKQQMKTKLSPALQLEAMLSGKTKTHRTGNKMEMLNQKIKELELKLESANERIKRLEEAGNNLLWNFCPEYTSDFTESQSDALKQWNKAKEAKP